MSDRRYLYCIIEGDELPSDLPSGLEGAAARTLPCDGIAGVVSPIARSQIPADLDNILLHELLVERLMEGRALLPVRFGTVIQDPEHVLHLLRRQHEAFITGLNLVRGKVELGVRVMMRDDLQPVPETPASESEPLGPGRSFMANLMRLRARSHTLKQRFEAYRTDIDRCLSPNAHIRRLSTVPSEKTVMNASYLVWLEQVSAFWREVERQRLARPDLQFLLTGPWPAYSFVTTDLLESSISMSMSAEEGELRPMGGLHG